MLEPAVIGWKCESCGTWTEATTPEAIEAATELQGTCPECHIVKVLEEIRRLGCELERATRTHELIGEGD